MAEKPEKERGNPIPGGSNIPPAPIPSSVRMSMVPPPPAPIPKEKGSGGEVGSQRLSTLADIVPPSVLKEELDAHPKGTIVINVFENSPYEVDFSGKITGAEIDIAWKAMMKGYRVWKHRLSKKETESGGA